MSIPSPDISQIEVGPLTIRFYALCLLAGMILAWFIGRKRWVNRGGLADTFEAIAIVAIPSGIVGARIYHVATHWEDYFGEGRDPLSALYIWEGGIAIFGAVIGGALGALFVCWRRGARITAFADSLAPGLILAQAVGRLGNYFNQELFGGPDDGPLGLEIDPDRRPAEYRDVETFQPTFLYELTWNALGCLALLWIDRRFKLGWGKLFALYMVIYGSGRFWIEGIRTDFSYMIGPLRTNQFTALLFVIGGLLLFAIAHTLRKGREPWVERAGVGGPDHVGPQDESVDDDADPGDAETPSDDADPDDAETPGDDADPDDAETPSDDADPDAETPGSGSGNGASPQSQSP